MNPVHQFCWELAPIEHNSIAYHRAFSGDHCAGRKYGRQNWRSKSALRSTKGRYRRLNTRGLAYRPLFFLRYLQPGDRKVLTFV